MATSRQHERDSHVTKPLGDWPNALTLQIDIENGDVETALVGFCHCVLNGFACRGDGMTERLKEILEHHRN